MRKYIPDSERQWVALSGWKQGRQRRIKFSVILVGEPGESAGSVEKRAKELPAMFAPGKRTELLSNLVVVTKSTARWNYSAAWREYAAFVNATQEPNEEPPYQEPYGEGFDYDPGYI